MKKKWVNIKLHLPDFNNRRVNNVMKCYEEKMQKLVLKLLKDKLTFYKNKTKNFLKQSIQLQQKTNNQIEI